MKNTMIRTKHFQEYLSLAYPEIEETMKKRIREINKKKDTTKKEAIALEADLKKLIKMCYKIEDFQVFFVDYDEICVVANGVGSIIGFVDKDQIRLNILVEESASDESCVALLKTLVEYVIKKFKNKMKKIDIIIDSNGVQQKALDAAKKCGFKPILAKGVNVKTLETKDSTVFYYQIINDNVTEELKIQKEELKEMLDSLLKSL